MADYGQLLTEFINLPSTFTKSRYLFLVCHHIGGYQSPQEIGRRVGRNQSPVMRICDRWMQESTTNRRGRSHPPQCATSREDRQIVRMAVTDRSVTSRTVAQFIESVTHHSVSARTIVFLFEREEIPNYCMK
ncbi:transposable element Tcb1 transposase [Trichonephila clavipes]|uniref:Transposable element Tcb1 transposase n=1 Tax=Trichonephila clavipes TaxID=2585209 RepID=A0A8X6VW97_TRICX|nr:transposable element Tcb1 transposase [Trichonephila clavipes]